MNIIFYNHCKAGINEFNKTVWAGLSRGVSQMGTAKEAIMEAFLTRLEDENFELLTVKDIIEKAGCSRSTFYLRFEDKYNLLNTVRTLLNKRLLSFYQSKFSSAGGVTRHLCRHVLKYRSFYRMEFSDAEAVMNLSDSLAEMLVLTFRDEDSAIFAGHGTIGYWHKWLKDGFVISPDEAAEK